jgi:hypothetical protein
VNGGAYQPLTQLGADTTSYTDTNIPYNSAGDAEVQYEVVAVGQPDSWPPDSPAITRADDPPTSAPTSAPATSQSIELEKVGITNITVSLAPPSRNVTAPVNVWHQFRFTARVTITGTNLGDILAHQDVYSSTQLWAPDGTQAPEAQVNAAEASLGAPQAFVNTATWVTDPQGIFQGQSPLLPVPGSMGTVCVIDDVQGGAFLNFTARPGVEYSYIASTTRTYRMTFRNAKTGKTSKYSWGFTWTNNSCATTNADDPAIPAGSSYATSEKNGGKGRFISADVSGLTSLN